MALSARQAPLNLKRGIFGKIDEIRLLRWQNRLVLWILILFTIQNSKCNNVKIKVQDDREKVKIFTF